MVIYVGVFRTVKEMKTYTAYIVNFTICDLCLSLTMGVLVRPEPIFPLDGAKVTGFLQYFGSYAGYISVC
ncbi:unnamed protein product [Bursaphelenchus okinawaensis]|uniref:G_PROTEIN_RECEP_F1_2 domain-containing protein n=1 Tax=Bursaphelenchus okinawaensis TaxID=465554 RepID=A0A811KZL5_9BILA|nr:unnamed protein product [Bursaphelenchus okinawaensis]CAG9114264.1 unnamed protein product [Bursaphelenchus okinawaensis]